MANSPALDAFPEVAPAHPPQPSNKFSWSAWLPVIVCVLTIAAESTTFFGADHTSGPLRAICEFFLGPLSGPRWWRMHHYIRKTGHFVGFGLLSASWFRAFWMTWRPLRSPERRRIAAHSLAMLGTFVIATADETHQIFLPNRTASPWDVALDCCGGAGMQLLIWLWMRRRVARESLRYAA